MLKATLQALRRAGGKVLEHPFVLVPFVFYYLTAARTVGMADTAILVGDIRDLRISAEVNSHNFSILFGRLFSDLPFGNLAFRCNLMSVFFGSLTIVSFYFLVRRVLGGRLLAAAIAAILMVSHSMWWHSTIVESYAINAFLMTLALHLLVRYHEGRREGHLLALIGLSGLSIFHHAQLGVIGLGAIVVAVAHVRGLARGEAAGRAIGRFVARAAAVSVASLSPWLLTLLHDAVSAGGLSKAFAAASGGDFRSMMFEGGALHGLREVTFLTFLNFPSPFVVLVPAGALCLFLRWRSDASAVAVATMLGVNTVFFALFDTWDRYAFLLISFVVMAFLAAFAAAEIRSLLGARPPAWATAVLAAAVAVSVVSPPFLYRHLAPWGSRHESVWYRRYNNLQTENTYDLASYLANPDKRSYWSPFDYANLLFEKLPPNSIYLDDDSRFFYSLDYYRKYEGRRADFALGLVNSWGFSNWGLSQEQFASLLAYAYDANLPLFLVSLRPPFNTFLAGCGRPYRLAVFPLDSRRWIYRLVTAAESGSGPPAAPPFLPSPVRTVVGYRLKTPDGEVVRSVASDRGLMVRFEFERNAQPFPVTFRWLDDSGTPRFSSPAFVAPAGTGGVAWPLDWLGLLHRGGWRVEVWVGASRVDETTFEFSG